MTQDNNNIGSLNAALTSGQDFYQYFQSADVFERRKIVDELNELVGIYNRGLKKILLKTACVWALYIFFVVNTNPFFWATAIVMLGVIYTSIMSIKCWKNSLTYQSLIAKCNRIWFENENP